MLNITCEYPDAAKINLVKDCETATQKLDRPARLRTILHIKLLVKAPLFCPGNDLIFSVTKYGMKFSLCKLPGRSALQSVLWFFIKFFYWK